MTDRYAAVRRLNFNDWHEILYEPEDRESKRIVPVAVAMLEQLAETFDELVDARGIAEDFSQKDVLARTTAEVIRRATTFDDWYSVWFKSSPDTRFAKRAFSTAWRLASTFKDWARLTNACCSFDHKEKLPVALNQMMKRSRTFNHWLAAWRFSRYVLDKRPAIELRLDRLTKTESQRLQRAQAVEAEDLHRQILRQRGLRVE